MVLWESYEVNQDLLHSTRYYDGLDVRLTSELSPQVCHDDICYQFRFYILIWLFYIWSVFPVILYTSSSWRIEQGQRPNGIFYFHKIQRYFCHWNQKQETKSKTHNFININLFILLYCFITLSDPISVVWWLFEESREREREREVRCVNKTLFQCTAQN